MKVWRDKVTQGESWPRHRGNNLPEGSPIESELVTTWLIRRFCQ